MNDDDFLRAFAAGSLPPGQFHRRDHLRLAWLLIRRHGADVAGATIASGIRSFAARHGQSDKYHETMTQFWVRIVGHMVQARPDISDFDTFVAAFPIVLDTRLPYRHWQRETMGSTAARSHWVDPDLLSLPA